MRTLVFRTADLLRRATEGLSALLLVAVVATNVAQIFYRYVLVDPLSWAQEAMRYSTLWMVMLAAAPALLRNEHMAMSLLDGARSPAIRRLGSHVVHACVAAFCVALIVWSWPVAIENMRQVSPAMRVPMTIPYLAIPIGATLLLINALCLLILPADTLQDDDIEDLAL